MSEALRLDERPVAVEGRLDVVAEAEKVTAEAAFERTVKLGTAATESADEIAPTESADEIAPKRADPDKVRARRKAQVDPGGENPISIAGFNS